MILLDSQEYVWVRRQVNDYRTAMYPLDALEDPHWDNVSGGSRITQTQDFIFGYVICNAMLKGELAHFGLHGPCPHRIKVCVLKKDNPEVIEKLIQIVGRQPRRFSNRRKHHCITDIMDILGNQESPMTREKLLEVLENRGHSESAMVNAIKKDSRIIKERDPDNRRSWIYGLKK